MVEKDDDRLRFISFEKVTTAPDGLCNHYKDRWWVVAPEKGVLFWKPHKRWAGHPQCNSNEALTKSLMEKLYPWAEIRFMPSVFVKAEPRDYL